MAGRRDSHRCRKELGRHTRCLVARVERRSRYQRRNGLAPVEGVEHHAGLWYAMQASYDMWQAQKHFRGKVQPIRVAA